MKANATKQLKDGARCKVVGGTHVGKRGTVHDIKKPEKADMFPGYE